MLEVDLRLGTALITIDLKNLMKLRIVCYILQFDKINFYSSNFEKTSS